MDVMQVNINTDDTTTRNVLAIDMEWGSSQLDAIDKEWESIQLQIPTPKKRGTKGKDTPPTPPTRRIKRKLGQHAGKEDVIATTTLGEKLPTATSTQDGGVEINTTPIPTRTPVAARRSKSKRKHGKYTDITKLSSCQFCNPHVFLIYQL